jgi:hypothetical protein
MPADAYASSANAGTLVFRTPSANLTLDAYLDQFKLLPGGFDSSFAAWSADNVLLTAEYTAATAAAAAEGGIGPTADSATARPESSMQVGHWVVTCGLIVDIVKPRCRWCACGPDAASH